MRSLLRQVLYPIYPEAEIENAVHQCRSTHQTTWCSGPILKTPFNTGSCGKTRPGARDWTNIISELVKFIRNLKPDGTLETMKMILEKMALDYQMDEITATSSKMEAQSTARISVRRSNSSRNEKVVFICNVFCGCFVRLCLDQKCEQGFILYMAP